MIHQMKLGNTVGFKVYSLFLTDLSDQNLLYLALTSAFGHIEKEFI